MIFAIIHAVLYAIGITAVIKMCIWLGEKHYQRELGWQREQSENWHNAFVAPGCVLILDESEAYNEKRRI